VGGGPGTWCLTGSAGLTAPGAGLGWTRRRSGRQTSRVPAPASGNSRATRCCARHGTARQSLGDDWRSSGSACSGARLGSAAAAADWLAELLLLYRASCLATRMTISSTPARVSADASAARPEADELGGPFPANQFMFTVEPAAKQSAIWPTGRDLGAAARESGAESPPPSLMTRRCSCRVERHVPRSRAEPADQ
jgi:hypothetical protein